MIRNNKAAMTDAVTESEEKNRMLAYEAAAAGIVLLENDGTLPIEPCRIALYGAGAEYTIKGGSGSGEVNVRHTVNVLEGLTNAGFEIATEDWISRYDSIWKAGKEVFIAENRKKLRKLSAHVLAELMAAEYRYPSGDRISEEEIGSANTDTCVYVIARQSGEGHDRRDEKGSFRLDDTEVSNIKICAEKFNRFVLVINSGAPVDLTPLDEMQGINAVVYMGQLGMEGGTALADILTGKRSPEGRLAVTWPLSYSDVPCGDKFGPYADDPDHAYYEEGIYVGYRYYDTFGVKPRYPFGYGLGYTDFEIHAGEVRQNGKDVSCSVSVKNSGKVPGRETVQLYVSCPQSVEDKGAKCEESKGKELKRLVAFGKTSEIAPGEEELITLSFTLEQLVSYDEKDAETYLDAGEYLILIGASCCDCSPAAVLRLTERTVVSRHHNLCGNSGFVAKLSLDTVQPGIMQVSGQQIVGLSLIEIDTASIVTTDFTYDDLNEEFSEETLFHVRSFTVADMAAFCAGTGLFGEKEGFHVPGAVGHSTTGFIDKGIPNVEFCDGPAGLRVQRRSTIDKKGKIRAVDASISLYEFLPDFISSRLLGNPEKEQILYQYVTGFPVAAMIAQTWDTDLAERIGRAVGCEMEEYGVTYWLAPALNIVRNPLCGRNYEYYSEDPLISGKLAAAVTRGVQERPGRYVTIKHFAVNNQEENRYYVSSEIDERALREIYLRGFEIAVRESSPQAVMTAYNRINGTFCANSSELCTDILRKEWGFRGIVMTDWLSTGEDRADEALAIESGVDLIMPGGKKVVKTLIKAQKKGTLSAAAMALCAKRVIDSIIAH